MVIDMDRDVVAQVAAYQDREMRSKGLVPLSLVEAVVRLLPDLQVNVSHVRLYGLEGGGWVHAKQVGGWHNLSVLDFYRLSGTWQATISEEKNTTYRASAQFEVVVNGFASSLSALQGSVIDGTV
jgi:hypothetical protein